MIKTPEQFERFIGLLYDTIALSLLNRTSIKIVNRDELISYCKVNVTRVKNGNKTKYFLNYNKMTTPTILLCKGKEQLGVFEELMQYNFKI